MCLVDALDQLFHLLCNPKRVHIAESTSTVGMIHIIALAFDPNASLPSGTKANDVPLDVSVQINPFVTSLGPDIDVLEDILAGLVVN